jgi:hypothetical protein
MAATLTHPVGTITAVPGRARWATVRIETETGVYVGRLYVPETRKRLSDVLNDDRPFLSLTEASTNDSDEVQAFVAVNKRFVRTVRVLDEGTPELPAPLQRTVGEPYRRHR